MLKYASMSAVSSPTFVSPAKPTSTYVRVTDSPYPISVPPLTTSNEGIDVTVWNTPVSLPVSSILDGLLEKPYPPDADRLKSVDELAAESHSMIDIAYV